MTAGRSLRHAGERPTAALGITKASLSTDSFAHGAPDDARRVVTAMLAAPDSDDDPWRAFPLGDGYLWPERRSELRSALLAK